MISILAYSNQRDRAFAATVMLGYNLRPMGIKTYIQTLGCKVNRYDSDALSHSLGQAGFEIVQAKDDAELMLINSCSVTANAEKDARYLARRFKAHCPNGFVAITGCYAQTDGAGLAELEYVDAVIPNAQKEKTAEILKSVFGGDSSVAHAVDPLVRDNRQGHFKSSLEMFDSIETQNSRAFLKIQDGCNSFCTYCLIPYARGQSRSLAPEKITAEVERLVDNGFREIVFTGIHIGDYGKDFAENQKMELAKLASVHFKPFEHPIANLLTLLFCTTDIASIRLSSLEPGEISADLVEVLAKYPDRVCPHFHLPLQSGSDGVLKRMRRSYTSDEYKQGLYSLREVFPKACFGADIMPGFPGESFEDHQRSLEFAEEVGLDYLHVFPYSKRPNTAASKMPGHVSAEEKRSRAKELRNLSEKLQRNYASKFVGTSLLGVLEQGRDKVMTQNNLRISLTNPNSDHRVGQHLHATLRGFGSKGELIGTL